MLVSLLPLLLRGRRRRRARRDPVVAPAASGVVGGRCLLGAMPRQRRSGRGGEAADLTHSGGRRAGAAVRGLASKLALAPPKVVLRLWLFPVLLGLVLAREAGLGRTIHVLGPVVRTVLIARVVSRRLWHVLWRMGSAVRAVRVRVRAMRARRTWLRGGVAHRRRPPVHVLHMRHMRRGAAVALHLGLWLGLAL